MAKPIRGTCENCALWDPTPPELDKNEGYCRRNVPVARRGQKGQWPITEKTDWCGFHGFFRILGFGSGEVE